MVISKILTYGTHAKCPDWEASERRFVPLKVHCIVLILPAKLHHDLCERQPIGISHPIVTVPTKATRFIAVAASSSKEPRTHWGSTVQNHTLLYNSQTTMGSQAAAAVVCELAAFPGRETASSSIDSTRLDTSQSSLSLEAVAVAWGVTLYLYTGLNTISFQTRTNGNVRNRTSEIRPNDDLATITTRLHGTSLESTQVEHRNNTAVIFDPRNSTAPQDASDCLWPGVDVTLCATQSSTYLAFRANLIAPEEARNLAETFCHVLQIFTANNGDNESAFKTVRDVTISPSDLQNIVQWNSGQLVIANVLAHEEFSRMASRHPMQMPLTHGTAT